MNKKDKSEIYFQIINGYNDLLKLMNNITEDNYQQEILTRIDNEIKELNDFIKNMDFIDNRECYAYKVAKEKLHLLNYLKGW